MAGRAVRGRRHPHHGRGDPRRRATTQLGANMDRLVAEALRSGTTTVECKSGYGLDRPRRAAQPRRSRRRAPTSARSSAPTSSRPSTTPTPTSTSSRARCSTPARRTRAGSTSSASAARSTATRPARSSQAGIAKGLTPRVHANQLGHGPGVQIAVELGAASADHVTHTTDDDVDALANSDTVATLLPGAEFCTRAAYPDARRLLDAGVTVALAADCNPGTSYTTSIPFCIALAVREMRHDPRRGRLGRDRGRRAGAPADRHRPPRRPARGPTPSCSTRRPTSTWPTGPASRSSPPSGVPGSARRGPTPS